MVQLDIDIPENCVECPIHDGEYGWCNANKDISVNAEERPRKCPIIEPKPTLIISETRAIPSDDDCVSLSETVTATYYNEENEEWSRKIVTVRDVLDSVCDEYTVLSSARPTEASCWGCNCPKIERLKEQKTFSEMVHLHDAETHDKHTETHSCDTISRQAAIDAVISLCDDCDSGYCGSCRVNDFVGEKNARKVLEDLPSAQKKGYTKADYIMALHKEYGCSLARAEEAHQKALEYLRNTSMMKG